MKTKADIGLIGLAVMGENLVLNMESNGFTVAVYNRTVEKVDKFINGRGKDKNFIGAHSIEEFIASLERPRKVMMLVKAGKPVDDFIELLLPLLEEGDIIIDGGNSHFPDTIRRTEYRGEQGNAIYWNRSFRWRRGCPDGTLHNARWISASMAPCKGNFPGHIRQG